MYDLTGIKLKPGDILVGRYFVNDAMDPGDVERLVKVMRVGESYVIVKSIHAFSQYAGKEETLPLKLSSWQDENLQINNLRLLTVDDVLKWADAFSHGARVQLAYYDLNANRKEIENYINNMGWFLFQLIEYWQRRGKYLLKEAQLVNV